MASWHMPAATVIVEEADFGMPPSSPDRDRDIEREAAELPSFEPDENQGTGQQADPPRSPGRGSLGGSTVSSFIMASAASLAGSARRVEGAALEEDTEFLRKERDGEWAANVILVIMLMLLVLTVLAQGLRLYVGRSRTRTGRRNGEPWADTGSCLYIINGLVMALASDVCAGPIFSSRARFDGVAGSLAEAWIWVSLAALLAGALAWRLGYLRISGRTVVRDVATQSQMTFARQYATPRMAPYNGHAGDATTSNVYYS